MIPNDIDKFYFFNKFTKNIKKTKLIYIIQNHNQKNFQTKKQFLKKQIQHLNTLTNKPKLTITFQNQYYNIKKIIKKN